VHRVARSLVCAGRVFADFSFKPPFKSKNQAALQKQILTLKVKYPSYIAGPAASMLKTLICRDPTRRASHDTLKQHPFFRGSQPHKATAQPALQLIAHRDSLEQASFARNEASIQTANQWNSLRQEL
jgi:hypothetical protein